MKSKFLFQLLFFSILLSACKKDPDTVQSPVDPPAPAEVAGTGTAQFFFTPTMGGNEILPRSQWYRNAVSDTFTVERFNYYISNIRLRTADNKVFSEVESYHLIKHVEGRNSFTMTAVPAGTYTSIEFLVGVDSVRNRSGAQTGDLDVKENMFWGWNQGYIFFKLEGQFKNTANPDFTPYGMHVGTVPCIEKVVMSIPKPLVIGDQKRSSLYFKARIDSVFNGKVDIDLDNYSAISDRTAKTLSTNYKSMFAIYNTVN